MNNDLFEAVNRLAESPAEETLEEIFDRGRQAVDDMDTGRWIIGDDALNLIARTIGGNAGDQLLADYAKEIGVGKSSVKAYRGMAAFYPRSTRVDYPNLTYSHFRAAKSLGTTESAYEMLEEASTDGWTVDELAYKIAERLGKIKPPDTEPDDPTSGPLLETIALKLSSWHPATGEIALIIDNVAAVDTFVNGWRKTKNPVVLTITEVEIGE